MRVHHGLLILLAHHKPLALLTVEPKLLDRRIATRHVRNLPAAAFFLGARIPRRLGVDPCTRNARCAGSQAGRSWQSLTPLLHPKIDGSLETHTPHLGVASSTVVADAAVGR